jgi:hypothetical protein
LFDGLFVLGLGVREVYNSVVASHKEQIVGIGWMGNGF